MPTPRWLAPLFRTRTRPIVTRSNKFRLRAEELEPREVPALAVAGAAAGEMPLVRVFDSSSLQTVGLFPAFGLDYRGGVNAALGDVNNDGTSEVIVATASGDGPAFVRILDTSGNEVRTLPPIAVAGGLYVASGDVNGDGNDDIVVSTVRGGLVGAFNGATGELMGVLAPYSANFFGGVQVAVADVDGDGIDDIITAPRAGGAVVKAFQGVTLNQIGTYDAAAAYTGPLNLAAGDVNGDGKADILLGTGTGVLPAAGVFDGASGRLDSVFFIPVNATGGMTVGVGQDANGDGIAEILLGPGGTNAVVSISPMTNGVNGVGLLPGGTVGGGLSSTPTSTAPKPALNAAPAITLPATFVGNENSPLALTGISVSDPDAGTGLVQVALGVTNGTLSLGTDGLTFTSGDGIEDAAMTFTGTIGAVNAALAGLSYAPTVGYLGDDELTVDVDDLGNTGAGGAQTASASAAIAVNNVNDPPAITSNGGGPTAGTSVAENGTAVATVAATDPDLNTTLTYSIVGGADAGLFNIDAATGALTFASAPDFEFPADAGSNNVYNVTVRASDGTLFDDQDIAVTVTDVNDNGPVFTSQASVDVDENTTAVVTVTATDADAGTTLTYSIVGGDDAGSFSIDASTGVLTFLGAPDFENPLDAGGDNVYDVIVQVSDGLNTDTQAIAVTVSDLNDNTPVITNNGGGAMASTSVSEGQTAVTTVVATDADAGTTLTYSIVGGDDSTLFGIDASTGVLTFLSEPSFAAPADVGGNNVYDVTVQVSDGTNTDTQAVAVTVTEVNVAPVVTTSAGTISYTTGDPAVVIDGAITITDANAGDMIVGATVEDGFNFAPGDVLAFDSVLAAGFGISGSYDGVTTGVLTFTGIATAAQYEAVLRTVTFATSVDANVTLPFTFTVDDGDTTGSDTKNVAVTSIT